MRFQEEDKSVSSFFQTAPPEFSSVRTDIRVTHSRGRFVDASGASPIVDCGASGERGTQGFWPFHRIHLSPDRRGFEYTGTTQVHSKRHWNPLAQGGQWLCSGGQYEQKGRDDGDKEEATRAAVRDGGRLCVNVGVLRFRCRWTSQTSLSSKDAVLCCCCPCAVPQGERKGRQTEWHHPPAGLWMNSRNHQRCPRRRGASAGQRRRRGRTAVLKQRQMQTGRHPYSTVLHPDACTSAKAKECFLHDHD
jgi:hypothetical protein